MPPLRTGKVDSNDLELDTTISAVKPSLSLVMPNDFVFPPPHQLDLIHETPGLEEPPQRTYLSPTSAVLAAYFGDSRPEQGPPPQAKRRKACSADSAVRRQRKEEEDRIKRPENAFILFRKQCCEDRQREDLKAGLKDQPVKKQRQADLSKMISMKWKELTPEERKIWEDKAKKKKKEHEEKYPNYVFRPMRKSDREGKRIGGTTFLFAPGGSGRSSSVPASYDTYRTKKAYKPQSPAATPIPSSPQLEALDEPTRSLQYVNEEDEQPEHQFVHAPVPQYRSHESSTILSQLRIPDLSASPEDEPLNTPTDLFDFETPLWPQTPSTFEEPTQDTGAWPSMNNGLNGFGYNSFSGVNPEQYWMKEWGGAWNNLPIGENPDPVEGLHIPLYDPENGTFSWDCVNQALPSGYSFSNSASTALFGDQSQEPMQPLYSNSFGVSMEDFLGHI